MDYMEKERFKKSRLYPYFEYEEKEENESDENNLQAIIDNLQGKIKKRPPSFFHYIEPQNFAKNNLDDLYGMREMPPSIPAAPAALSMTSLPPSIAKREEYKSSAKHPLIRQAMEDAHQKMNNFRNTYEQFKINPPKKIIGKAVFAKMREMFGE